MTSTLDAGVPICGLVLAGGQGRRMGSVDKGLVLLRGRPLVAHVIDRLSPQVASLLINANRHVDAYRALGHAVVADRVDGFAGPLAGLEAGLDAAAAPLLATVPCDSPFLPPDLVARLAAARAAADSDAAVVSIDGRLQPVFALVHVRVKPSLAAFLQRGARKAEDFYSTLRTAHVAFDDEPQAFANLNTREELASYER